ncbi:MAG: diacylglycerol kinase [Gammaproteobacteria bacterium]|nr:diacylglycerol kinase [Gammaproteobacteria bacterium]
MKNKPLTTRMTFALSGLQFAILSEKSIRFQLVVALLTIALLGIIQPELYWWAIIMLVIVLVLFAELVNTALEILCDYVQPEYSDAIKKVKDVAAGAVFVLSLGSLLIGLIFLMDVMF